MQERGKMENQNKSHVQNIPRKEVYTEEEKRLILERLNRERLERQYFERASKADGKLYSKEEKNRILQKLNEMRIRDEHQKEMKRIRCLNKEIYTFRNKRYFKLKDMEREYFLEVETCENFTSRPSIVPLYYRTFGEMKKKDVLLKIEPYSNKIFISKDATRVYFKPVALEERHTPRQ